MLMPERCTDRLSQVWPISSFRFAGSIFQKRVLPTTWPISRLTITKEFDRSADQAGLVESGQGARHGLIGTRIRFIRERKAQRPSVARTLQALFTEARI